MDLLSDTTTIETPVVSSTGTSYRNDAIHYTEENNIISTQDTTHHESIPSTTVKPLVSESETTASFARDYTTSTTAGTTSWDKRDYTTENREETGTAQSTINYGQMSTSQDKSSTSLVSEDSTSVLISTSEERISADQNTERNTKLTLNIEKGTTKSSLYTTNSVTTDRESSTITNTNQRTTAFPLNSASTSNVIMNLDKEITTATTKQLTSVGTGISTTDGGTTVDRHVTQSPGSSLSSILTSENLQTTDSNRISTEYVSDKVTDVNGYTTPQSSKPGDHTGYTTPVTVQHAKIKASTSEYNNNLSTLQTLSSTAKSSSAEKVYEKRLTNHPCKKWFLKTCQLLMMQLQLLTKD